jgi:hypothetical protein
MPVRTFHLFHGIVLTKLVRSDRPITLRMIETRPNEAWSSYILNDLVELYIKHSAIHRQTEQRKSWSFVFGLNQLKQMEASQRKRDVYVALVCGDTDTTTKDMQVCLLEPRHLRDLVEFSTDRQQSITINYQPGHKLRVFKDGKEHFKIAQGALDEWQVPGS